MSLKHYLRKTSPGGMVFDILNHLFLVLLCITILYPFWHLLLLSFATQTESLKMGFRIWNNAWTIDAYSFLFSDKNVLYAYLNTIFRTVVGTALMLVTSLMIGYPLSKKSLPKRNWITAYMLITMFVSGGLIPYYLLIRRLGLINSRLVYVIPGMVSVFNGLLIRNFIMAMGTELEESALIDGAGHGAILVRIVAPLSKPILATIALWTAVSHWNSWFDCLLFIQDDKKVVLQMIIRKMLELTLLMSTDIRRFMENQKLMQGTVYSENVRAAAVFITIGPIILVYPFVQKYFIKGIMLGSLKG